MLTICCETRNTNKQKTHIRRTFKNLGSHLLTLLLIRGVQSLRYFTRSENSNNQTIIYTRLCMFCTLILHRFTLQFFYKMPHS